jgi:hypothetical protein
MARVVGQRTRRRPDYDRLAKTAVRAVTSEASALPSRLPPSPASGHVGRRPNRFCHGRRALASNRASSRPLSTRGERVSRLSVRELAGETASGGPARRSGWVGIPPGSPEVGRSGVRLRRHQPLGSPDGATASASTRRGLLPRVFCGGVDCGHAAAAAATGSCSARPHSPSLDSVSSLQTPVSGRTSSTRCAASMSPASAAATERTCS